MAEKVLIISGSPRIDGNSAMLCNAFAEGAVSAGHTVEKISLAGKKIGFCTACYSCRKGGCPQHDDAPEIIQKMLEADIIVLATPVYFFTMCAQLKALIDRSGYVAGSNGRLFARKVGAAVTVNRRGGAVCAFDSINHFLMITGMIVPGSTYWNMARARNIGEAAQDEEAINNMVDLGRNIAWLLQKIHA